MSTSISEHARQEISEAAVKAAEMEYDADYHRSVGLNVPHDPGHFVQQAIDSATAAKDREIQRLKERVEVELTRGEGWCRKFIAMRKERDALQARVRELESYETNYHSLQVRLAELENQLIQKFKP